MQYPGLQSCPLSPVVDLWLNKLSIAKKYKKEVWQDDADEIQRFYAEPHDFMYDNGYSKKSRAFVVGDDESDVPPPTFRMTANKVAEFVSLFGPMLYHKNPNRRVNPRKVPAPPPDLFGLPDQAMSNPMVMQQLGVDPQMAMMVMQYQQIVKQMTQQRSSDIYRSQLMEAYLNYTPNELDLKFNAKLAIDEALVKGRGLLWTEVFQRPLGNKQKLVGSFFGSADDLFIDPDAESIKDALWVARRCYASIWETERKYGWPPGSLKGNRESLNQQALTEADAGGVDKRKRGVTCDQICYYEIWSRTGAGARLDEQYEDNPFAGAVDRLGPFLEQFGDFCYLAIAQGVPCPLNIPFQLLDSPGGMDNPQVSQQLRQSMAWPIPFYADAMNPWPFTEIDFHPLAKRTWPMPHMKPAMGYQKFLNWIYSLMANKIRITCRDIIMLEQGQDDAIKKAIEAGADLTILEVKTRNPGEFKAVVDVLKMQEMNKDVWQVSGKIEELFEKATGMTDVIYGMQSGPQIRSAQEAALKGDMTRIRPDAMANTVEDAMTLVARKEAMAARWMLQPEPDIAPVLGPDGAQLWRMLLFTQDVFYVVRELEYRIEANSTKKPNRDLDIQNTNDGAQFLFPVLMQALQMTGDPTAVNAFLKEWCKARDMDPTAFQVAPPPPPLPPQAAPAPAPSSPPAPASQGQQQQQGA